MRTIALALRIFFRTLFDAAVREQVARLLEEQPAAEPVEAAPRAAVKEPKQRLPRGHEALVLLAALQREARLVDFIQEPLTDYSDAQVGAAVRDIHRSCATVLERFFALRPLLTESEGARIEVPAGFDAARFNLTGNVTGQPPYRGALCHHGWQATRCELPEWTGTPEAAMIVAPAEVEL